MTDTPPDPLDVLVDTAIFDWPAEGPETMSEFVVARLRAAGVALDARPSGDIICDCPCHLGAEPTHARPSGDEALRAAEQAVRDLRNAEGTSNDERYDLGWYDGLGSALDIIARAALAAPVSPSPDPKETP